MSAPLLSLFLYMNPEIEKNYFYEVKYCKQEPTKLFTGMVIATLSLDTVASISTFVCGILGAIGVMKINAIGSYAMIGVSCSITAAFAIAVICKLIQNHKQRQEYKIVK